MSTSNDRIAASYARAGHEAGQQALFDQHSRNADAAEAAGFTIPTEYWFDDIGSALDKHRPGLQSLLDSAGSGPAFSRIYVADWARLSRAADRRHLWCLLGLFAASDVEVVLSGAIPVVLR